MAISKEQKTWNALLKSCKLSIASMKNKTHLAACVAIVHARDNGRCDRINQLDAILTKGMQATFKRYLVAVASSDNGDLATSWLTAVNGEYVINSEIKKRALHWREDGVVTILKTVDELAAKPTFHDIDPDKVKNPFSDESVVKQLTALSSKANKKDSEVNADIKKLLSSMVAQATKLAA